MFKGSMVALVTPFNEDLSVNYEKIEELIEWHIENKTDAIVVLGTTAEAATLNLEEKVKIVELAVKKVAGRIPVIAGSGSNNTEHSVSMSKKFAKLGVDGLLVVAPYYNKSNTQGFIKHFETIADSVDIPLILYNVPSRTGCNLSVEVVKELSKHKRICGIKEASGNISYIMELAKIVNDDFVLLSGNDDSVIPLLAVGGKGVISVAANVIPREFSDMVNSFLNGNTKKALDIQLKYLNLINLLFIEVNPIPVKEAMNTIGKNVGKYRLPLYEMSDDNKEKLINSLRVVKQ